MFLRFTLARRSAAWLAAGRQTLGQGWRQLSGRLLASRRRWRTRPLLSRLDAAVGEAGALAGEIESRFLGCGRTLEQQVQLTAELVREGQQLLAQDEQLRQGTAAVCRVSALTHQHLALAGDAATALARLARVLEDHAERLRRRDDERRQIERAFAPIRALQSLFRIESAGLPAALQSLFLGVADEMRRLDVEAGRSFAEQEERFAATRKQVLARATELHLRAAEQTEAADAKRAEVNRAEQRLADDSAQARQRHEQLDRAIAAINRETDAMVVSLQYQDITRQRLEHVQSAAREILAEAAAGRTLFGDHAHRQAVLCRVQVAQLGSVRADLRRAADVIGSGLQALRGMLAEIEHDSLSLAALRETSAATDRVVEETLAAHRVSTAGVAAALGSLRDALQETRSFAETTTGATDAMRRLAEDIHLMGLNAQVQAVQAHSGALEVLSGHTSQISQEAQTLSVQFESRLVGVTTELTRLVEATDALHRQTHDQHTALEQQGVELQRGLGAEREQARQAEQRVGELLERLAGHAAELDAALTLADVSSGPIEQLESIFAQLAEQLGAGAVPADEPAHGLEAQARYTMDAERETHERVLAGASAAPAAAEPVPATGGSEPMDSNVELF